LFDKDYDGEWFVYIYFSLILFSVRRTDKNNAKFATLGSEKTDNARRRRAAGILPPSLSGAKLVLRHCGY